MKNSQRWFWKIRAY